MMLMPRRVLLAAVFVALAGPCLVGAQGMRAPKQGDALPGSAPLAAPDADDQTTREPQLVVRTWNGGKAQSRVDVEWSGVSGIGGNRRSDHRGQVRFTLPDAGTFTVVAEWEGRRFGREIVVQRGAETVIDLVVSGAQPKSPELFEQEIEDLKTQLDSQASAPSILSVWGIPAFVVVVTALVGYVIWQLVPSGQPQSGRTYESFRSKRGESVNRHYNGSAQPGLRDQPLAESSLTQWKLEDHSGLQFSRYEERLQEVERKVDALVDEARFRRQPDPAMFTIASPSDRLYGEVPDSQGRFSDEALTREIRPLSLYEIEPSRDKNTARVRLRESADLHQMAIDNHKNLLLPACEYKPPGRNDTRISALRDGQAVRDAAGWRVIDKIPLVFS
jgi:hypothetical protein